MLRIKMLTQTNPYINIQYMRAYWSGTSIYVPGRPPGSACRLQDINLNVKNKILILTNLYLVIHEGMSEWIQYLYLVCLQLPPN